MLSAESIRFANSVRDFGIETFADAVSFVSANVKNGNAKIIAAIII